jgi:hypothetical protein
MIWTSINCKLTRCDEAASLGEVVQSILSAGAQPCARARNTGLLPSIMHSERTLSDRDFSAARRNVNASFAIEAIVGKRTASRRDGCEPSL